MTGAVLISVREMLRTSVQETTNLEHRLRTPRPFCKGGQTPSNRCTHKCRPSRIESRPWKYQSETLVFQRLTYIYRDNVSHSKKSCEASPNLGRELCIFDLQGLRQR